MTTSDGGLAAVHAAATAVSRADHDAAINQLKGERDAAVAKARIDGLEAGRKEGATAERTRLKAILGSEEANGREAFAQVYAFETDMTAEAAVASLKDKPKSEALKASRLDGRVPQPNVPAADATKDDPVAASARWDGIVADLNKQQGGRASI